MKQNLILTDILKTGNHVLLESFIKNHTLDEKIVCCGEYYTIQNFDLKQFDRKLAVIDHASNNERLWNSDEYWKDLEYRVKVLSNLGFVFIVAYPWESKKTFDASLIKNKIFNHINIKVEDWTGSDNWFWSMMYNRFKDKTFNFDHVQKHYDFLYLNKTNRSHRSQLFKKLKNSMLLKNSLYSFLDFGIKLQSEYELPWITPTGYPRYGHDRDIFEKPYNHTAINIVSETTTLDEEYFLTEKIWKPIIAEQVFIVHGKCGYLKHLKELGFQTFNNIFDESYDDIIDENQRIEKIDQLCQHLITLDYKKLYEDTQKIREHNRKIFFDKLFLGKAVNKTLTNLFKFFDSSQVSS